MASPLLNVCDTFLFPEERKSCTSLLASNGVTTGISQQQNKLLALSACEEETKFSLSLSRVMYITSFSLMCGVRMYKKEIHISLFL